MSNFFNVFNKEKKTVIRKKVPKRPLTPEKQKQQELYEKFLKSKPGEKFLLRKKK